jgi:acyl dehydratase
MDGVNTRSRATIDEMRARIGSDFGNSDWMLLDQPRISAFAELTDDL